MQPIDFAQANKTFTKPEGMTDEECSPLRVQVTEEALISKWMPSDVEKAGIAAGEPVTLSVYSRSHPPVMLHVERGERPRCVSGDPKHICGVAGMCRFDPKPREITFEDVKEIHEKMLKNDSGCADGCSHPDHKSEIQKAHERLDKEFLGPIIEKAVDEIEKTLSQADRRKAFIGGLYAKAEVSHLKRVEATVILSATFAEMIEQTIPGLEDEEAKLEPGCIARANVALMIEIARAMREESLAMVDAAMASSRLIVVPR
jgi:hypothetical protein